MPNSSITCVDGDIMFINHKNTLLIFQQDHGAIDISVWLKSASMWNHLKFVGSIPTTDK